MGSPSDLFLAVDMQNRQLVAFSNGGQTSVARIPDLFQSNVVSLKVMCLNPGTSSLPVGSGTFVPYQLQNMGNYGMRAAVGPAPAGLSGPAVLALQNAMTWDAVNQWFAGDLALNTTGIDNFLGPNPQQTAYFELNLTVNGTRITILQTTFTIKAVVDELTGTVPTPADQYLTANEIKAAFMPRIGSPGDVLTLTSPSGLIKTELGTDDNGQLTSNRIQ